MKHIWRLCAPAVLLIGLHVPAAASELPKKHHGVWEFAGFGNGCKTSDWGKRDSMMKLSGQKVEFWESQCRFVAVTEQGGKDDAEYLVDRLCGGEGEEWIAQDVWQFAEIAGQSIAIFANVNGKRVSVYTKCDP